MELGATPVCDKREMNKTSSAIQSFVMLNEYKFARAQLARHIILGMVEGFTEFLPISSTGHLLLTQASWTGLRAPGVAAFYCVVKLDG